MLICADDVYKFFGSSKGVYLIYCITHFFLIETVSEKSHSEVMPYDFLFFNQNPHHAALENFGREVVPPNPI